MSEKLPMIVNGNFSFGYYETSNKKEVEQYYEVDLGELNLIAQHSKTKGEKDSGRHTDLELKTYNYHRDEDLLIQTIPTLSELNIGTYTSIDEVVIDFDKLFLELLKTGHFLKGTKTACLLKSVIPAIDHPDFEYFFIAKLHLVSKKHSRIDKFLDFQLQSFLKNGKSTTDFTRFLRLVFRQFANEFDFSGQALKTIEEWVDPAKTDSLDGVPDKIQKTKIKWTGDKGDLLKIIYASFYNESLNKGDGEITKIANDIFDFFGLDYAKSKNLIYSALKKADDLSHENKTFLKKLDAGFEKFLEERKKRAEKKKTRDEKKKIG